MTSLRRWWLNRAKGILNDEQIELLCAQPQLIGYTKWSSPPPMISPFRREKIRKIGLEQGDLVNRGWKYGASIVSMDLSFMGYDMSLGWEMKLLEGISPDIPIDPKKPETFRLRVIKADRDGRFIIPPLGYALGVSHERFCMPENVMGICLGKSTYARIAGDVNLTPLEPGWCGYLTLEISNDVNHSIALYPGEGIAQVFFLRGFKARKPYGDGKYQNQGSSPREARV